jgi:hypothetical protein
MVRSSRLAHDGSTLLSSSVGLGISPTPLATTRCCRTSAVSSGPGTRSARGNAERRSARWRHSGAGCNHAPRPGSRRRGSGVSNPFTATTRSRSSAADRLRHPTHVRTGVRRTEAAPRSWAGAECSAALRRSVPASCAATAAPARKPVFSRPTPTRERRMRSVDRRRCGCRCASRSIWPPAGRFALPCRSPARAGSRGRRRAPFGYGRREP